jgi:hypothetical protein
MKITLYKLYKSTIPTKKYDVYVENYKTNKIKKVSFGGKGYSDYTIHKDYDRMLRYKIRHHKDKIYDITSPGFWSWWVLWNKTSLQKSLQYTKNKFKLHSKTIDI